MAPRSLRSWHGRSPGWPPRSRVASVASRLLGRLPGSLRGLTPPEVRTLVEETRADGRARDREIETGYPPRVLRVSTVALRQPGEVLVVVRDVSGARRVEAMRRGFLGRPPPEPKNPPPAVQ